MNSVSLREIFRDPPIKSRPMLLVSLVLSALISATVFYNLRAAEQEQIRIETQKIVSDFDEVFRQFSHPLEGIVSSLHFSNFQITPENFRRASESRDFYRNFEGALGFGFIRRVPEKNLSQYLVQQRRYRPDFNLRRLQQNAGPSKESLAEPSSAAEEDLFVIEVVEPFETNQQAVGLVVSDEENRKRGALQSMLSGFPTVTSPIQLVQVDKKEPGFLLFKPVYKSATAPLTEQERKRDLIGWAYAPILFSSILKRVEARNLNVAIDRVFEILPDGKISEVFSTKEAKNRSSASSISREIQSMGQVWKLDLQYLNRSDWSPLSKAIPIFLLLSATSFLFFFYLRSVEMKNDLYQKHLVETKNEVISATEKIQNQKIFLQKMIDMMPAMIGYWDKDLTNRLANRAYFEYFGRLPQEILGMKMRDVLGPAFDKNQRYIEGALAGEAQFFERELPTASGLKTSMARYIPDIDETGHVLGFFVLVVDITEMKQTQKELDRQKIIAAQNEKLRSLGEMAAGMAHEINNPLAIINGGIQLLPKFRDQPEKFQARIQQIGQSIERISKIINGLRRFSHTSENEAFKNASVNQIVESSLVLLNVKAKGQGVSVIVELEPSLEVFVNEIEVEQILINLVGNAIDAVKSLAEKWVQVKSFAEGETIVLQIQDSGGGIPLEVEKKLFEPFFTTKSVGEGTGLGLSISKGLAEKNGGSIRLNRSLKNTCFELRFPRLQKYDSELKHAV